MEQISSSLDRRPLYPETLTVSVPRGTRQRIRARAAVEGVSVSDFGRRILAEHLTPPPEGLLQGESMVFQAPDNGGALISVVAADVPRMWFGHNLDRLVLAANRKVPGSPFDPSVLRRACEVGQHQLWMTVVDADHLGVAVTGIFNEPDRRKVLDWVLVAGRGFARWRWTREHIEAWARQQGCCKARAYARPGWRRTGLSDYEPKGVILERAL